MPLSSIDSTKKTKLSEAIGQNYLKVIRDGLLDPGQKLPPDTELCHTLGVSRTALREGIKALSGVKVLSTVHGKGTYGGEAPDILVEEDVLSAISMNETVPIDKTLIRRSVMARKKVLYAACTMSV